MKSIISVPIYSKFEKKIQKIKKVVAKCIFLAFFVTQVFEQCLKQQFSEVLLMGSAAIME